MSIDEHHRLASGRTGVAVTDTGGYAFLAVVHQGDFVPTGDLIEKSADRFRDVHGVLFRSAPIHYAPILQVGQSGPSRS